MEESWGGWWGLGDPFPLTTGKLQDTRCHDRHKARLYQDVLSDIARRSGDYDVR